MSGKNLRRIKFSQHRAGFIFICAMLSFFVLPVSALDRSKLITQYIHDVWKTNDGLPQNSVNAIMQTSDGYLWIATQEGLARFDGIGFKVFDENNTSVMSSFVHTLFVDSKGVLWIGAGGGLIAYENGKFTPYSSKDGLPDITIKNISEDSQGNLWLGAGGGNEIEGGKGLTRFAKGRGEIFTTRDGLSGDQIYSVLNDNRGNLWIGTGSGLNLFKDGKFTSYTTKDGLSDNFVETVYQDRAGNLWIGTLNGLTLFKDGRFTVYTTKDGLVDNRIHRLCEDREGNLWIGTDKGLNLFRDEKFADAGKIAGLENIRIKSLFEDREGSLWIGTIGNGLHRLRDGKFTPFGVQEGLLSENIYGIFADSLNRVWVNSVNRGLNLYENNRFTPIKIAGKFAESTVYEDRTGNFWFGTGDGLTELRDGKFRKFALQHGLNGQVSVIHQTRNGDLWLGSRAGLWILNGGRLKKITAEDGFQSGNVKLIYEDQSRRVWISTNDGLFFYKNGKFTLLTENVPRDFNVQDVSEDEDGTLWFATWSQGLHRFKDGKLAAITTRNGLYDNIAWSVLDDHAGNLWMGSNRGIFRVAKRELSDFFDGRIQRVNSIVYGTADGMRERETNSGHPAAMRAPDGKLWFGTTAGTVVIDPNDLKLNNLPPPVVLQEIFVDEQNILFETPPVLAAGTRNVEFHYAGLSYISPEKIQYKYKLENFDDNWIDAGNRREAFYTNLPPGDYEFRVIAANADGVWNERGAGVKFRVLSPFWKTWWFLFLSLIVVSCAAYLLHRQRMNRLEKRRLAQEEFSRRLLASQETERQRIAAELHDSIGQSLLIIKHRATLALGELSEPEIVREQLEELGDSAAAVIEECREISYNLRPFQLKRFGLTKTLEAIFGRISEVTEIKTAVFLDSIDGLFSDETEANIYRIVQECVGNIVKHSAARNAEFVIKRNDKSVDLRISDDGRGFGDTKGLNSEPKKSGFGLIGIKERVRLMGGEIVIESAAQEGTNIIINLSCQLSVDI